MKNSNYVCFNCKISKRYTDNSLGHNCHLCGNKLLYVYYKFEIPPKSDLVKWKLLHNVVYEYNTTKKKNLLIKYTETLNELRNKIEILHKNDKKQNEKLNKLYEDIINEIAVFDV